jgi:hypothetical protein
MICRGMSYITCVCVCVCVCVCKDHNVFHLNQQNLCISHIREEKDRPVDKNYWFTKNVHYVTAGWVIMRHLFVNVLEEKRVYNVTNKNWDLMIVKYKGVYFECD